MKALALTPGKPNTTRLINVPEPHPSEGDVLCEMIAVGICGTDREIMSGAYGESPPDAPYLIIGHESLGRVLEAPLVSGFKKGDIVVGIVRHPDPVPCPSCARNEWDMCTNGLYTERGIKQRHGFASERFRVEPAFCVTLDPKLGENGVLMEPTTVVAKAWEQTVRILARAATSPTRVLVTGAGPVGLLAAMIGRQKNFEVHVLDRNTDGPKQKLVEGIGAIYHTDAKTLLSTNNRKGGMTFDIMLECTGAAELIYELMESVAPSGILCLAGVSSGGRSMSVDIGALNRDIVLQNEVIFGSVNANRAHYAEAADALAKADQKWLSQVITRRVALADWQQAFAGQKGDVKVILTA